MPNVNPIQTKAMLATLAISQWTARKQDKKVTAEVERAHSAHDSGRFNKDLVNKALLEPISKLTARVREYHYYNTHAWADSGARLLPTKLFMPYADQMRQYKNEFDGLVKTMLAAYPAEVQAARNRLGTMYRPEDYPDTYDLRDKFSIRVDFEPVPDGTDFRVDLAEDVRKELCASVMSTVAARQTAALNNTYDRVREVVSKIAERLSIEDAVFRDTLITNASDLCVVLDALNITEDENLTKLAKDIRTQLVYAPTAIRASLSLRQQVAEAAHSILSEIPGG